MVQGQSHVRTSLQFGILWDDGFQERDYDADLASSQPFQQFVKSRKELYPLQFNVKEAKQAIRKIRKEPVSTVTVGSRGYISLRIFDGIDRAWYDGLALPKQSKLYVVPYVCTNIVRGRALLSIPILNIYITCDNYEVLIHCYDTIDEETMLEVVPAMRPTHPAIWQ